MFEIFLQSQNDSVAGPILKNLPKIIETLTSTAIARVARCGSIDGGSTDELPSASEHAESAESGSDSMATDSTITDSTIIESTTVNATAKVATATAAKAADATEIADAPEIPEPSNTPPPKRQTVRSIHLNDSSMR